MKLTRRTVLQGISAVSAATVAGAATIAGAAKAQMTPAADSLECDGTQYDVVGTGPDVLCSHGFMMDRTMFRPQLNALSDEYRVAAYDSRARTPCGTQRYDLYELGDDCGRMMDHLRAKRCVLIGMSMGGWMALRFALKNPDRLDGVILIDSSANIDDAERRNDFSRFEALRGRTTLPEDYVDWVSAQMFGEWTRANNTELVSAWRDKFLELSGDAVYCEAESWRYRDDLSKAVAAINLPTLVLHGAQDTAEPLSEVTPMVDAIPNAELVVIENAGHTSNLEQPVSTNDAIRRFLKSIYG